MFDRSSSSEAQPGAQPGSEWEPTAHLAGQNWNASGGSEGSGREEGGVQSPGGSAPGGSAPRGAPEGSLGSVEASGGSRGGPGGGPEGGSEGGSGRGAAPSGPRRQEWEAENRGALGDGEGHDSEGVGDLFAEGSPEEVGFPSEYPKR